MNEFLQVALGGLVIAGYVILWRMDRSSRSAERIQRAARRNVAEHKRTVTKLKHAKVNWEKVVQDRHDLNSRYSETIERIRAHHRIEDAA